MKKSLPLEAKRGSRRGTRAKKARREKLRQTFLLREKIPEEPRNAAQEFKKERALASPSPSLKRMSNRERREKKKKTGSRRPNDPISRQDGRPG